LCLNGENRGKMKPTASFIFLLVSSCILLHSCHATIGKTTKALNALLDPETYDSRVRPGEGGGPVEISINVFVASLTSISENDQDYTVDVYLRQSWKDERLEHSFSAPLVVPPRFVDKIWYPDLFVSNEKSGELHTITQPNRYIRINGEGEVMLSQRFTLRLACPMEFKKFPFDIQTCGFKFESYGYDNKAVVFKWTPSDPIKIAEDTQLPSYELSKMETLDCTKVYSTGAFTCIESRLTFSRMVGYFIFNTFIPSFVIVALTWLAFWILPSPAVTRFTLIAICLLSAIGLMETAKRDTPQTSYVVALDVWMVVSLVFIIGAMVETALVTWMYQNGEQNEAKEEQLEPGVRRKRSCCDWKSCAIKVDILCRFLIPAVYFGWAGFYWFVYTKFDL